MFRMSRIRPLLVSEVIVTARPTLGPWIVNLDGTCKPTFPIGEGSTPYSMARKPEFVHNRGLARRVHRAWGNRFAWINRDHSPGARKDPEVAAAEWLFQDGPDTSSTQPPGSVIPAGPVEGFDLADAPDVARASQRRRRPTSPTSPRVGVVPNEQAPERPSGILPRA